MNTFIEKVKNAQSLSETEASSCLHSILHDQWEEADLITFLEALITKGESIDEISGFAKELIKNCVKISVDKEAIDLCGTGGSGLDRFNVSTTVAFVLAAGGFKVAKHGNKGSKRPNGAFDLLEELKINFLVSPEELTSQFNTHNLCFMFARTHHPAMKAVGPARAKLGKRSIFNIVGPLSNPAQVNYQIVGVSKKEQGADLLKALVNLGKKKALVVYGEPGIDEFSISGPSTYWFWDGKEMTENTFNPNKHGIELKNYQDLPHGLSDINAELFLRLLEGDSCGGLDDMISLNAGAAIFTLGKASSIQEGYFEAKALLSSGKVKTFFDAFPKS